MQEQDAILRKYIFASKINNEKEDLEYDDSQQNGGLKMRWTTCSFIMRVCITIHILSLLKGKL